jgi:hypothetical protein
MDRGGGGRVGLSFSDQSHPYEWSNYHLVIQSRFMFTAFYGLTHFCQHLSNRIATTSYLRQQLMGKLDIQVIWSINKSNLL